MITPAVHAFLCDLGDRYNAMLPLLPIDTGQCDALASLCVETAEDHGLDAQLYLGEVRTQDCLTPTLHAWCEVCGLKVHSPRPGVIEVQVAHA